MTGPTLLACTIPGTPQQQGSKTRTPQGGMREANRDLESWRAGAITFLQRAVRERWAAPATIGYAVSVEAVFAYGRPKGHYGTGRNAGRVKPSAPTWKASAPDLDKLQRALGDALTQAGVLRDDALIVQWMPAKVWGDAPETRVVVRRAD